LLNTVAQKEAIILRNIHKIHRGWIILAGMILIQAGIIGVLTNCTGILFAAILADTGFRAGDLSVFYLIRSLSSALTVGFTCRLFFEKNARLVLAFLGTMYCASIGAMFFFGELWQWYVAAVFAGIGSGCSPVAIPIVLNNWFHEKNGFVIGVTMSASGVAGAVFSPICSKLLTAFGWRMTAVIMAGTAFVLIVAPTLLILVPTPEKAGCQPYGARLEEAGPTGKAAARAASTREPQSYIFVLCLMALLAGGSLVQFSNQLPTYAQSVGYAISVGGIMTSCCMVGNLLGKLVFGTLIDWIGIYRAVRIYLTGIAASMVIFLLFFRILPILYVGAFFYGIAYAISTMSPSLLFLDIYGEDRYKAKVSRAQAINSGIFAIFSAAFPYVYDWTGSFDAVFVFGIILCGMSFLILCYLQRYKRGALSGEAEYPL